MGWNEILIVLHRDRNVIVQARNVSFFEKPNGWRIFLLAVRCLIVSMTVAERLSGYEVVNFQ